MPFNKNSCPRCMNNCVPLSNVISESGVSFVCVGANNPEDREVQQDRFTLCWKNDAVDERGHWDKRDLLDTVSVITQALSIDENIRVNLGDATEEHMQQISI